MERVGYQLAVFLDREDVPTPRASLDLGKRRTPHVELTADELAAFEAVRKRCLRADREAKR